MTAETPIVFVTPSSHMDIDFTDTPDRCLDSYAEFIRRAVLDAEADGSWRFTIEHSLAVSVFLRRYPEMKDRLIAQLTAGRIDVSAVWTNPHFADLSGELLVRQITIAKRYLKDALGYDAEVIKTGELADITAQLAQVCADCGIRIFQTTKTTNKKYTGKGWEYGPYWFFALNGRKALFLERQYSALTPELNAETNEDGKTLDVTPLNAGLGIFFIAGETWDDSYPVADNVRNQIDIASRRQSRFRLKLGTLSEYVCELEKRLTSGQTVLPERVGHSDHGELLYFTFQNEDKYAARSVAEDRLPDIEKLYAILTRLGLSDYPTQSINDGWEAALNLSTHNWGFCHRKETDYFKRLSITAVSTVERLETAGLGKLAAAVNARGLRCPVLLFNSEAWARQEPVWIDACKHTAAAMVSVPALGYAVIDADRLTAPDVDLRVSSDEIENAYYRIAFNSESGVRSIIDKVAQRELIDATSPCGFGRILSQSPFRAEYPALKPGDYPPFKPGSDADLPERFKVNPPPRPALYPLTDCIAERQPGCASIVLRQSGATVRITLCSGCDRLFVTTDAQPRGATADAMPESWAHIVFAFNMPETAAVRTAIPYGSMPLWPGDFYDDPNRGVSNKTAGIPAFQTYLNEKHHDSVITPQDYPNGGKRARADWAHISDGQYGILYAMRNPYGALFRSGNIFYKAALFDRENVFVFKPCDPDWRKANAARFGAETSHPIRYCVFEPSTDGQLPLVDSFASIHPETLVLTTMKKNDETGDLVARYYETSDTDVKMELTLSDRLAVSSARLATMTEERKREVSVAPPATTIRKTVGAFDIETIVLVTYNAKSR